MTWNILTSSRPFQVFGIQFCRTHFGVSQKGNSRDCTHWQTTKEEGAPGLTYLPPEPLILPPSSIFYSFFFPLFVPVLESSRALIAESFCQTPNKRQPSSCLPLKSATTLTSMYELMLPLTVDTLLTVLQDFIIDIDNIEAHGTHIDIIPLFAT